MSVKHDGFIGESFLGRTTTAGCSCGWQSDPKQSRAEASEALIEHYADPNSGETAKDVVLLERIRCAEICNLAREGVIDTDLRSVRHAIESGASIEAIRKMCGKETA